MMNLSTVSLQEAQQLVSSFPHWHHKFEIYPGIITPGAYEPECLMNKLELPNYLQGKKVLDIGASNGYFARECDRRGAEVTAIDYRSKDLSGFSIMEKLYGKSFKHINCNLYELENYLDGKFDIVLMLGVIYHLPDIVRALWLARKYCQDTFILETQSEEHLNSDLPLMRYYKKDSLAGDITNFWSPNTACVVDMLEDVGFRVNRTQRWDDRLLVHCSVNREDTLSTYKLEIAYNRLK